MKKKSLFNNLDEEELEFKIDLDKGLYIGSGVLLIQKSDEDEGVIPIYIPWKDLAGHLSVFGTTRVGKTRLMVSMIRQVVLYGWDILLVEPKGAVGDKKDAHGNDIGAGQETLAWVTEFAEEAGRLRDIRYISPKFPDLSLKFNPLYGMSNEEIASLVATIIPAKEEFFAAMGYQVTMSVLLGLDFLEKVEGREGVERLIEEEYTRVYSGKVNIVDEISGVSDPDLATRVAMNTDLSEGLNNSTPPYRSLITFADIATYATQDGVLAILDQVKRVTSDQFNVSTDTEKMELKTLREESIRALTEMAEKDKQYYSKVSSSFNIVMQQLSTGALGKLLCSVKINPVTDGFMRKEHGMILIIQPFPLIFKNASDAFIRVFFSVITSLYGNVGASGRSTPRKIAMFVDEGGAVMYEGVEQLFNKAGGLGLRIFMFTQSLADYEAMLGPELSKIVNDNTNIKIYLRMNDNSSRQSVSESFGKIMQLSTSFMGSKDNMRISSAENEKDVLLPSHMGDMKNQEFLLQYGNGKFYCCAPFQPDPGFLFRMPQIDMEKTYIDSGSKFMSVIKDTEENTSATELN